MSEYELIRAKRRTVSLQIERDGRLVVRAPYRMPLWFIEQFIAAKWNWVQKTHNKVIEKAKQVRVRQYKEGELFLYLGQEYPLVIQEQTSLRVVLEEGLMVPALSRSKLHLLLSHWYQEQARQIITEIAKQRATLMNVAFSKIRITAAKTRWGSCSASKNLSFSWRLVMAPVPIIEYVVVHELAHLKHLNHSKAFWQEVEAKLPDYKARRAWLKHNGHILILEGR